MPTLRQQVISQVNQLQQALGLTNQELKLPPKNTKPVSYWQEALRQLLSVHHKRVEVRRQNLNEQLTAAVGRMNTSLHRLEMITREDEIARIDDDLITPARQ